MGRFCCNKIEKLFSGFTSETNVTEKRKEDKVE